MYNQPYQQTQNNNHDQTVAKRIFCSPLVLITGIIALVSAVSFFPLLSELDGVWQYFNSMSQAMSNLPEGLEATQVLAIYAMVAFLFCFVALFYVTPILNAVTGISLIMFYTNAKSGTRPTTPASLYYVFSVLNTLYVSVFAGSIAILFFLGAAESGDTFGSLMGQSKIFASMFGFIVCIFGFMLASAIAQCNFAKTIKEGVESGHYSPSGAAYGAFQLLLWGTLYFGFNYIISESSSGNYSILDGLDQTNDEAKFLIYSLVAYNIMIAVFGFYYSNAVKKIQNEPISQQPYSGNNNSYNQYGNQNAYNPQNNTQAYGGYNQNTYNQNQYNNQPYNGYNQNSYNNGYNQTPYTNYNTYNNPAPKQEPVADVPTSYETIVVPPAETPQQVAQEVATEKPEPMVHAFCSECGAKLNESDIFCKQCGTKVQ